MKLLNQLTRFGAVGVTAATIHFCLVVLLVQHASLHPLMANVAAFLVSFQVSYWGHRRFTFPQTITLHREAYSKLILLQLANLAANEGLFYFFLSLHLPYQLALIIVLTILPVMTFTISKFWVFQ